MDYESNIFSFFIPFNVQTSTKDEVQTSKTILSIWSLKQNAFFRWLLKRTPFWFSNRVNTKNKRTNHGLCHTPQKVNLIINTINEEGTWDSIIPFSLLTVSFLSLFFSIYCFLIFHSNYLSREGPTLPICTYSYFSVPSSIFFDIIKYLFFMPSFMALWKRKFGPFCCTQE